ncbi:acetyl-coenzyme A transporter 1-domain-containing protein [Fimicolochytrium jonesii]|uniref:acetyl-coenzyme A transporter 1-domain-containing protein n=1 Tax=Fimicolochytrium jonesii TaxID=1396493 RepID=UPI0022FE2FEC|nr:acetyl-coenzyme A transporter 1-domain-containing protein [Fimicolochytrium jonesii]KAI8817124.1 acetyl-coenzyme A transporter 1-domain-containing protein [Fimicolochytrium jonesii]
MRKLVREAEGGYAPVDTVTNHDSPSKQRAGVAAHKQGVNPLWKDKGNVILLVVLYLLQGVPLGLTFGAIPFLLKSKLSYADIATFSLSGYPYSLKLLWSPIVDSFYFKSLGRRKSWIVPIQALTGLVLLGLGSQIEDVLNKPILPVKALALAFTALVFLCATQDIAVDGWALTLLREENKHFASTAQTIGLNTGYFLSFTIFLALNSPEFCNKFLRNIPAETGVLALGSYLKFWGSMFLLCNAWLIFVKKEDVERDDTIDDIKEVYSTIWEVCKKPHMKKFIGVLLLAKIGFIANEAVTPLKLLDKGLKKEDMALSVLIDFPFQILFGYYAAKWSSGKEPLRPWLYAFYGRLAFAGLGMLLVNSFPEGGASGGYFFVVMAATVLSSFTSTVQFVGMGSFFTKISDPLIGGTYMTLLNTLSNLGGTWPRYFVLESVELLTTSHCESSKDAAWGVDQSCSTDTQKAACKDLGGTCVVDQDGYYVVGIICVVIGFMTLVGFIRPMIKGLYRVPDAEWRLKREDEGKAKRKDEKAA